MKLIIKYYNSDEKREYIINNYKDLEKIYEKYPSTYEISSKGKDLEDSVRKIASYLSSHWNSAYVEDIGDNKFNDLLWF